jgi:hypothetical protein
MIVGYYIMNLFSCPFWPCIAGGILFGLGLGLGKEFGDMMSPGNKFDFTDLLADLLGLVAGTGIVLVIGLISRLIPN